MKNYMTYMKLFKAPQAEPLTGLLWWGPFVGALITIIPVVIIAIIIIRWRKKR